MANADDLAIKITVDASPALDDVERLRKALVAIQPVSPRFSLKGWSLQTWLAKNANFVKKTLTTASTVTGAIAVTDLASLRTVAIVWGLAAAALVISAGLDAVHYFISDVPLEPKP